MANKITSEMRKTFLTILIFSMIGCSVERIIRPPVLGYIYDSITLKKIDSVEVITWDNKKKRHFIETFNDNQGTFFLKIKKQMEKSAIGGETSMGFFSIHLSKKGYEDKKIQVRNKYGFTKDTIKYDSIFLNPKIK